MQAPIAPHLGIASSQWRSHSTTLSRLRLEGASSTSCGHCIVALALSQHHTAIYTPCRRHQHPIWALHCHSGALTASHSYLCAMQAQAAPDLGTASLQWRSHSTTLSRLRLADVSSTSFGQYIVTVAPSQHHDPAFASRRRQQHPICALHRHTGALTAPHCHVYAMQAPTAPYLGTTLSQWCSYSATLSSLCHAGASSPLSWHLSGHLSSSQWRSHSTTLSLLRPPSATNTPSGHYIVTVAHSGALTAPHSHLCAMQALAACYLGPASSLLRSHSTTLAPLHPSGANNTRSGHCIVTMALS